MARHKSDPSAGAAPVPGDLAGSVASALLWLDVATLSLERDDLRDLRSALSQARAQLQAVAGALTTAERRTDERRMAEQRRGDRRSSGRSADDRRSGDRRGQTERAGERRTSGE